MTKSSALTREPAGVLLCGGGVKSPAPRARMGAGSLDKTDLITVRGMPRSSFKPGRPGALFP